MNISSRWERKKRVETVIIGVAIVFTLSLLISISTKQGKYNNAINAVNSKSNGCDFPAVFNFGDSNSDTGEVSAAFGRLGAQYGEAFFGGPSGRYSDGRLIIDYFAEKLGLPYLSAYLDSIGANFSYGANFAASGSTIMRVDSASPFHLSRQLSQFEQLKERSIELYNRGSSKISSCLKSTLPRAQYFSEALYTMDTGQNDLHVGLEKMAEDQLKESIPSIIDHFASSVEALYQQGARVYWIHNTGPIGCLPFFLITYPPKPENMDPVGCIKSYNEVAQEFNKQLKDKVSQLRTRLKDASLIYVDIYTVKYSLISEAKGHGFIEPLGYCCGHHGYYTLDCWDIAIENATGVDKDVCKNPSKYISWDKIHYTEAANHWFANRIMDGSHSDPQIPIFEACNLFGKSR